MKMKNETAIITGSTSGIGKELAKTFLEEGCKVSICSRNPDKVMKTVEEFKTKFGDSVIGFPCDVSNPKALKNAVQKTVEKFGSIRILVANAGLNRRYGPFNYLTSEEVAEDAKIIIGTNLIGTMNAISAVLPEMIKQKYGRIVTLSGGGADRPLGNMTLYSASKGGVVTFSKCLALELSEREEDIKINIYQPGMLKTNLSKDVKIVSGWKSNEEMETNIELAFEYMSGDIRKSCLTVIPYVLPENNKNGENFRGFSLFKLIRGAMKMNRMMKKEAKRKK